MDKLALWQWPEFISEMEALGFVDIDVEGAVRFCLHKGLLEVDTSSSTVIKYQDSVKTTAGAWAHMRILTSRVEYIASVLPTTPMNDKDLSARVFEGMQQESRYGQIGINQQRQLAELFHSYLMRQQREMMAHPGFSGRRVSGTQYVIEKIEEALRFAKNEDIVVTAKLDDLDL